MSAQQAIAAAAAGVAADLPGRGGAHPPAPAPSGFCVLRSPLLPFTAVTAWSQGLEAPACLDRPGDLERAPEADRERLRKQFEAAVTSAGFRDALVVAPGKLRAEEAARPGCVFAEIVHVPEGRIGNMLGRPVIPRLTNAHNHNRGLGVYRFLPRAQELVVYEMLDRLYASRAAREAR